MGRDSEWEEIPEIKISDEEAEKIHQRMIAVEKDTKAIMDINNPEVKKETVFLVMEYNCAALQEDGGSAVVIRGVFKSRISAEDEFLIAIKDGENMGYIYQKQTGLMFYEELNNYEKYYELCILEEEVK